MSAEVFLDTNVLLYLLSADTEKADRADALVHAGATISVQVLNEFTAVGRRRLKLGWDEIADVLTAVRSTCVVEPLTVAIHDAGRRLAQHYGFTVYDAMIVGSALGADCSILYTEDMHTGLVVQGQLVIRNPFLFKGWSSTSSSLRYG